MEHSHSRNSGDTITTQLGELIPTAAVDVDEAVHVADTEALDGRLWVQLPLRAETIRTKLGLGTLAKPKGTQKGTIIHSNPAASLAVVSDNSVRGKLLF